MTARDVTRVCAFFSARKSGIFLHILGRFLTKLHSKPGEREKIHWRKFKKSSGDSAPKLQISVPCLGARKGIPKNLSSQVLWIKGSESFRKFLGRLRMILCYWKTFTVPNCRGRTWPDHLMCQQLPFWCGIRCKTLFWDDCGCGSFGP